MELAEIHKFEQWIENTVEGVLSPLCENIYRTKRLDANESPRISFEVKVGSQFQKQKFTIFSAPGWIYSTYEGTIELTISTNRTDESESGTQHALVGNVRARFHQYYFDLWQNAQVTILPVLVFDVRPAENENSVVESDDIDSTLLTYKILFCINKNALPTNL